MKEVMKMCKGLYHTSILYLYATCCVWQKLCSECHQNYCQTCLIKLTKPQTRYICRKCQTLSSVPLEKTALMNLRIRDLKWYLDSQSISFAGEDSSFLPSFSKPLIQYFCLKMERVSPDVLPPMSEDPRRPYPTEDPEPPVETKESLLDNPSAVVNVADIQDPLQIEGLSVRQLKLILTRNYVDYHGCCEKKDLQERVRRLWMQRKDNMEGNIVDENLCKLCMVEAIDCVLLECGHMATCTDCGKRLAECPICSSLSSVWSTPSRPDVL
ncbi:RFFL [Cordylochernes scorpioides]|uniref:RFFL n=1 Tax=Cordylochernes scorpioides TaxID=51811 RepID=A0ABY6KWX7_9ARAC|nr:RFFL [Cordylochernes scorpioides]